MAIDTSRLLAMRDLLEILDLQEVDPELAQARFAILSTEDLVRLSTNVRSSLEYARELSSAASATHLDRKRSSPFRLPFDVNFKEQSVPTALRALRDKGTDAGDQISAIAYARQVAMLCRQMTSANRKADLRWLHANHVILFRWMSRLWRDPALDPRREFLTVLGKSQRQLNVSDIGTDVDYWLEIMWKIPGTYPISYAEAGFCGFLYRVLMDEQWDIEYLRDVLQAWRTGRDIPRATARS